MYKIIGADQKEYGPASAGQVRAWIAEGRVNAATLLQSETSPEWKPLSTFPEFSTPPIAGPTHTPAPIFVPPAAAPKTNGYATTGLIMGILACICPCCGCIFSILGIVFSGIALSQITQNPRQTGKGMAIAGLILSVAGIGVGFLLSLLFNLWGVNGHQEFHWP